MPRLSAADAVASITVQEKLMAVGLEKVRLLVSKQQCDADGWWEACKEYMKHVGSVVRVHERRHFFRGTQSWTTWASRRGAWSASG